jgi:hypothetical protein
MVQILKLPGLCSDADGSTRLVLSELHSCHCQHPLRGHVRLTRQDASRWWCLSLCHVLILRIPLPRNQMPDREAEHRRDEVADVIALQCDEPLNLTS